MLSDVVIRIIEDELDELGPNRPAAIGHVLGTKPDVTVYLAMPAKQFERAWMLAAGGRLSHAWISMTPPHYGSPSRGISHV